MKKTAEEILREVVHENGIERWTGLPHKCITESMERYAQQYHQEKMEEVAHQAKEDEIGFAEMAGSDSSVWSLINNMWFNYETKEYLTSDEFYTKYKQSITEGK